jgi:hypothetical protein
MNDSALFHGGHCGAERQLSRDVDLKQSAAKY